MPVVNGLKVDAVQIGQSATDSQNFQLSTGSDGTAKLARGSDGSLGDILTVDGDGKVTLANATLTQQDSLPTFACRAWGNFVGSTGALNAGGNASITRNSAGSYAVTFTTAMPDKNYSVVVNGYVTTGEDASSTGVVVAINYTNTGFTIDCERGNATPVQTDPIKVSFAVFR